MAHCLDTNTFEKEVFPDGLTGDVERDRRADGAVFFQVAGEGGAVVFVNGINTHAAAILPVFVLQLDSSTVSQPHQLLAAFTLVVELANQRHDFIELDLDNPLTVETWFSLDFYTLGKEKKERGESCVVKTPVYRAFILKKKQRKN